jgi:hypothetical protein
MTIQTRREFAAIPGVVEVLSATPALGHVTLRVDGSWPDERLGLVDDGSGEGDFPIGCVVHAERAS